MPKGGEALMTFNRDHLIKHGAWKAHQASGCTCGMDNPPTADVEAACIVVDTVEPTIRADERAKIAAWLRETYREQNSWLWYELGEGALEKVAAYIEGNKIP